MSDNTRQHQNLMRRILLESGKMRDVFLVPNPVGQGFTRTLEFQLYELAKQGPEALWRGYRDLLYRNRITYGIGPGSTDTVGHVGGCAIFGEVKTGAAELEPEQRKWHEVEKKRGAIVDVWRSVEDFKRTVEEARCR